MPQTNYALVWPQAGGFINMAAGSVVIDFISGDVARENGTRDKLSTSLNAVGFSDVKSILVESDQTITVQFDGGFKYQVSAQDIYRIPNVSLKSISITASRTTNIRIWASTDPDGVPERYASSIVGGKVTASTTSSGRPFIRAGRGSVTGTYTTIASYTVPAGSQGNLREVGFTATRMGSVQWKVRIAGQDMFRGVVFNDSYSAPFPDNTLGAGTVVLVQATKVAGSYNANAAITGKNY